MPEVVFPATAVYVQELDTKYDAHPTEVNGVWEADVTIPPNTTSEPIVYTLEVYTNDNPTGITSTVTVDAYVEPEYHEVSTMNVSASNLSSSGGTVGVTINFDVPAEP